MAKKILQVDQTPTITAGAYTTGKALGGKLQFQHALNGGDSKVLGLLISDKANQKVALDLLLFNADFTPTADAATLAISAADLAKCVGVISIVAGDYVSLAAAANAIATKANLEMGVVGNGYNDLWGQLVVRGSATFASTSDISAKLVVEINT